MMYEITLEVLLLCKESALEVFPWLGAYPTPRSCESLYEVEQGQSKTILCLKKR